MDLKEKVAIVTGGAQGIGAFYVLRLSEEGARVVIADIKNGDRVKAEVMKNGGEALALHTDVSSEESTKEMAEKTLERFGRIDILVNNAAYFAAIVKKPFFEISADEWDAVIAVNLKGPFLCAKAVYPQMKQQGKGKIINISSGAFYKGLPHFLHYVTTKGGIIGFTRSLAREVGDAGICVNTIAPGYTETDILKENPQDSEEVRKMIVMSRCIKRPETPEDLTGTLVFLASDDSDFVTGQTIIVDGGSALS
ncbi:MAG: 3-oxoacyl-ACP reductase FabG [Deltaproteobacteria bacterium]|nr:3-oxoacyl-ACP reductase FabG [Deltaproteobacteria bacterium]